VRRVQQASEPGLQVRRPLASSHVNPCLQEGQLDTCIEVHGLLWYADTSFTCNAMCSSGHRLHNRFTTAAGLESVTYYLSNVSTVASNI